MKYLKWLLLTIFFLCVASCGFALGVYIYLCGLGPHHPHGFC